MYLSIERFCPWMEDKMHLALYRGVPINIPQSYRRAHLQSASDFLCRIRLFHFYYQQEPAFKRWERNTTEQKGRNTTHCRTNAQTMTQIIAHSHRMRSLFGLLFIEFAAEYLYVWWKRSTKPASQHSNLFSFQHYYSLFFRVLSYLCA